MMKAQSGNKILTVGYLTAPRQDRSLIWKAVQKLMKPLGSGETSDAG